MLALNSSHVMPINGHLEAKVYVISLTLAIQDMPVLTIILMVLPSSLSVLMENSLSTVPLIVKFAPRVTTVPPRN